MVNQNIDVKPRVLFVDDVLETRQVMATGYDICRPHFTMEFAASANEARELYLSALAEEVPFDLIVSDIAMPAETGLSLCRWIRARGDDVTLIFFTGYDGTLNRFEADDLGAVAYLTKPAIPPVLFHEIEKGLYERRSKDERDGATTD